MSATLKQPLPKVVSVAKREAGRTKRRSESKRPKSEKKHKTSHPGLSLHVLPPELMPMPPLSKIRPVALVPLESRDTKEAPPVRWDLASPLLRGFLKGKVFRVPVATVVSISSNGSGFVNATFSNSTMTASADFVSLAAIFEEFFIRRFDLEYVPVSQYNVIQGGTAGTQQQNIPLAVVSLQHATPAFTSINSIPNHESFRWNSTGRPFSHSWVNDEDPRDKVLVNDTLTAVACQSWCQSEATPAGAYTGQVQFYSTQTASVGTLPVSALIGFIAIKADILWRQRD